MNKEVDSVFLAWVSVYSQKLTPPMGFGGSGGAFSAGIKGFFFHPKCQSVEEGDSN